MSRILLLVTLWIVMVLTEIGNTKRKQIWGKKISSVEDILTLMYLQNKYLKISKEYATLAFWRS